MQEAVAIIDGISGMINCIGSIRKQDVLSCCAVLIAMFVLTAMCNPAGFEG